jgi:hypothetical protein
MKEHNEQTVGRDAEDPLHDKRPHESGKRISSRSARPCIKMLFERERNQLIDVDAVREHGKELGFVAFKRIEAVGIDVEHGKLLRFDLLTLLYYPLK